MYNPNGLKYTWVPFDRDSWAHPHDDENELEEESQPPTFFNITKALSRKAQKENNKNLTPRLVGGPCCTSAIPSPSEQPNKPCLPNYGLQLQVEKRRAS